MNNWPVPLWFPMAASNKPSPLKSPNVKPPPSVPPKSKLIGVISENDWAWIDPILINPIIKIRVMKDKMLLIAKGFLFAICVVCKYELRPASIEFSIGSIV